MAEYRLMDPLIFCCTKCKHKFESTAEDNSKLHYTNFSKDPCPRCGEETCYRIGPIKEEK